MKIDFFLPGMRPEVIINYDTDLIMIAVHKLIRQNLPGHRDKTLSSKELPVL
jgi:hypothetical protein